MYVVIKLKTTILSEANIAMLV